MTAHHSPEKRDRSERQIISYTDRIPRSRERVWVDDCLNVPYFPDHSQNLQLLSHHHPISSRKAKL